MFIELFNEKFDFFNQLQFVFNRTLFLIHFDFKQNLFINVDVFKKRKFKIMIYYIKNVINSKNIITLSLRITLKSIMFLNKILSIVEKNY